MIVIGWIILSIVVGAAATSKGRSFFGYFLLALLLSPLIGLLVLIIVPSLKAPPAASSTPASLSSASPSPVPPGIVGSRGTGKSLAIFIGLCLVAALLAGIVDGGSSTSSTNSPSRPTLQPASTTSAPPTAPPAQVPPSQPNRPLAAPEIMEAQQHLFDLGFDPGPRDGVAGANTSAAVRRFEIARALEVTGALDLRMLEILRSQKRRTDAPAPAASARASDPPTNTPNKAHNMLVAASRDNQLKALGAIVGCPANSVAFRWL